VGRILAVTPSGSFTLRAPGPEVAPEGTRVTEPTTGARGVVARVFGPVAQPYLSVRPRRAPSPAEGVRLIGATMWVE
jgi:rRNA processing protein Gar1